MNKCIFIGRLVRDPEIRYTQGAQPVAVAIYILAVDRKFKREGEPPADYLNFVAYSKLAEFAEKFLKKGIKIAVTARVQTRSYTNKEGHKVYVTEFIVEEQEFTESKGSGNKEQEPIPDGDGFFRVPDGIDEELPFS